MLAIDDIFKDFFRMKITIYGSGYVGLVTGTCFAQVGNEVLCVDIDQEKINKLQQGIIPIYEPGLEQLVHENTAAGRLKFTTDSQQGVSHGTFQFIAVGTPPDEDGSADLQYVLAVAKDIATHLQEYRVVINKSTVPVGTATKVKQTIDAILQQRQTSIEFDVVSNPEFLKEGAAIEDFMRPDRIVCGTDNPRTAELLNVLYAPFTRNHGRMLIMDIHSAELTKYAANAMLATKISFMNELSNIAERVGADIENVRLGIGSDPRIGYHFIYPGCGYGGSCFPKDVRALEKTAREFDYHPQLLEAVEQINHQQKQQLFNKVFHHFQQDIKGKIFAVWGLAFKPNTDDMREASSRVLLEMLWQQGAKIQAYDPVANGEAERIYPKHPDLTLVDNPMQALEQAEALIIVTEWNVFRSPDFQEIKQQLKQAIIFDGRNMYDPQHMKQLGFIYYAIGRGESIYCR